jgi:hypothetical protein
MELGVVSLNYALKDSGAAPLSLRHLHRYLSEFDFRYSLKKIKDNERTRIATEEVIGKRLLYRYHQD